MTMLDDTVEVMCPHCGESITLRIELSVESQSYIEDCPVCCQPMTVSYTTQAGELSDLQVEAAS